MPRLHIFPIPENPNNLHAVAYANGTQSPPATVRGLTLAADSKGWRVIVHPDADAAHVAVRADAGIAPAPLAPSEGAFGFTLQGRRSGGLWQNGGHCKTAEEGAAALAHRRENFPEVEWQLVAALPTDTTKQIDPTLRIPPPALPVQPIAYKPGRGPSKRAQEALGCRGWSELSDEERAERRAARLPAAPLTVRDALREIVNKSYLSASHADCHVHPDLIANARLALADDAPATPAALDALNALRGLVTAISPSDIGTNKAVCQVHRCNLFHGTQWEAHPTRFDGSRRGLRIQQGFIIGCVDSAAARREIYARLGGTSYWLDLGNTQRTAQVILGHDHADRRAFTDARYLPDVLELFPAIASKKHREDRAPSCSLAEALQRQDLFINQAVATWALHLLWQWFTTGVLHIHGYFINLETGTVQPLKIDSDTWLRMNPRLKPRVDDYRKAILAGAIADEDDY